MFHVMLAFNLIVFVQGDMCFNGQLLSRDSPVYKTFKSMVNYLKLSLAFKLLFNPFRVIFPWSDFLKYCFSFIKDEEICFLSMQG